MTTSNVQGVYKITNGDQVTYHKNLLTTQGKNRLIDCSSGRTVGFATSIVAGIGTTAANVNDRTLEFMVGGSDVNAIIPDYTTGDVYFKATLPNSDDYTIYELGCFSTNYSGVQNSTDGGSLLLVAFGSQSLWTDITGVSTFATTNNRIGPDSIQYASFSAAKGSMNFIHDLSILTSDTTFDFAYYTTGVSSLKVRFKVDVSNYFECATWPVTTGYHISKIAKSTFTSTGTPDWSKIQTLEVEAAGTTATLSMDAIRYTPPAVNNRSPGNLLSHVILTTPQRKLPGVSIDIEYKLNLDIS